MYTNSNSLYKERVRKSNQEIHRTGLKTPLHNNTALEGAGSYRKVSTPLDYFPVIAANLDKPLKIPRITAEKKDNSAVQFDCSAMAITYPSCNCLTAK